MGIFPAADIGAIQDRITLHESFSAAGHPPSTSSSHTPGSKKAEQGIILEFKSSLYHISALQVYKDRN